MVSGCHYVGSPAVGFGKFFDDTHIDTDNPNAPRVGIENMRRAAGQPVDIEPLVPEAGNVWPGPPPPEPTLEDVQKEQNQENQQIDRGQPPGGPEQQPFVPHPQPRGSSTPPGSVQTQPSAPPARAPFNAPNLGVAPPSGNALPPVIDTPQGNLVPNDRSGGPTTATQPGVGGSSLIVPNGNGTSTVIGPNGETTTIPTPK